jgi:hypothetical protein
VIPLGNGRFRYRWIDLLYFSFSFFFGLDLGANRACARLHRIPLLLTKSGRSRGIDFTMDDAPCLRKLLYKDPIYLYTLHRIAGGHVVHRAIGVLLGVLCIRLHE